MRTYRKRVLDEVLQFRLSCKGAVLIEGIEGCGKTTTATQQAKSAVFLKDPPDGNTNALDLALLNPNLILDGSTPRLIDEWQEVPELWDTVRGTVDDRGQFGQFIFTGSSVPKDLSKIRHSGIGRFVRIMMRPMSLFESGESTGEVSLKALFDGAAPCARMGRLDLNDLAFLICRGGWTEALDSTDASALLPAGEHLDQIIGAAGTGSKRAVRHRDRTAAVLRSCARALCAPTTLTALSEDLRLHESIKLSDDSVGLYLKALKHIFALEDLPAWSPCLRSKALVRTTCARYFTDPSLAAAALNLTPDALINDIRTMGMLFKNLCVRDLRVLADHLLGSVSHFRDSNGLECDAVIELRNRNYALIEIALGGERWIEEAAATLNKLERTIDTSKMSSPSFKMVLTGLGKYAYVRKDGVMVVPIGALGV